MIPSWKIYDKMESSQERDVPNRELGNRETVVKITKPNQTKTKAKIPP